MSDSEDELPPPVAATMYRKAYSPPEDSDDELPPPVAQPIAYSPAFMRARAPLPQPPRIVPEYLREIVVKPHGVPMVKEELIDNSNRLLCVLMMHGEIKTSNKKSKYHIHNSRTTQVVELETIPGLPIINYQPLTQGGTPKTLVIRGNDLGLKTYIKGFVESKIILSLAEDQFDYKDINANFEGLVFNNLLKDSRDRDHSKIITQLLMLNPSKFKNAKKLINKTYTLEYNDPAFRRDGGIYFIDKHGRMYNILYCRNRPGSWFGSLQFIKDYKKDYIDDGFIMLLEELIVISNGPDIDKELYDTKYRTLDLLTSGSSIPYYRVLFSTLIDASFDGGYELRGDLTRNMNGILNFLSHINIGEIDIIDYGCNELAFPGESPHTTNNYESFSNFQAFLNEHDIAMGKSRKRKTKRVKRTKRRKRLRF